MPMRKKTVLRFWSSNRLYQHERRYAEPGKKTGFKDTEKEAKRDQCVPFLDETKADHYCSPDDDDSREEESWTQLP